MKFCSRLACVAFLAVASMVPLISPPEAQAGPLARAGRALVSRRLERRANAALPRQRIARAYFGGYSGSGSGCRNSSCGF